VLFASYSSGNLPGGLPSDYLSKLFLEPEQLFEKLEDLITKKDIWVTKDDTLVLLIEVEGKWQQFVLPL
jgi:oligoribonuclease NrnB/cAMP/cGMP phosphodiesterase (DHH superfamily)